jgi:DNA-binding response OmpR family regulator
MAKLLVVEDDQDLSRMVEDWLAFDHHRVELVHTGADALELLEVCKYDLIILDWELPQLSGLELCKLLRAKGDQTPVLMLTGKGSIQEKLVGFKAGADDYLTKPFHMKELAARVLALLRRPNAFVQDVLKVGNLSLDPARYEVTNNGAEVQLSPKEFALLEFLMRHPNQVFSPEALLERVWTTDADVSPQTVRTCMGRLRQKIDHESQSSMIETLHGVGYKLGC